MSQSRFTISTLAPVLFLGLLLFSCTRREEPPPAAPVSAPTVSAISPDLLIVATVDGDPITLAEFLERFQRAGFKPEHEAELEAKGDFLNRLIERKMLLREAHRRRIKIGPQEIDKRINSLRAERGKDMQDVVAALGVDYEKWKSDIWEDLVIERLMAKSLNRHTPVQSSEVRKYYQENAREFERPDQVRVRQIVVATEEEAQKMLALLRAQKDFAQLAREKSTAPEAERGGDLGYFARGDMPAEFNVVFGLAPKGISGVVKSPYGYHIFKLEDKRRAGRVSIDEAYKSIADKLRREKEDLQYKAWFNELRARTKLEVNYQALKQ